jgi:predicted PurR-regulated permease PerM
MRAGIPAQKESTVMQVASLAWGILALVGMVVGFIPCLGWMNWINIPFAFGGLIFGVIAHVVSRAQNRNNSLVAIILCILAILIGSKRLVAGWGIF